MYNFNNFHIEKKNELRKTDDIKEYSDRNGKVSGKL